METARKEIVEATLADQEFQKYFLAKSFEELQLNTNIGFVLKTLGSALAGLRMIMLPSHHCEPEAFKSIISSLVVQGGDADTNAAVLGALLGCSQLE